MSNRYGTKGGVEGEYQPGSDDSVLKNKLDIADIEEMEATEFETLVEFQTAMFGEIEMDTQITAQMLCDWHRDWLGNIYDWAGKYRTVNLEKDGFMFSAAHLLKNSMSDFEKNYLSVYTPCHMVEQKELVHAMLNLLLSILFAMVMAV